ncbi:hypothetical protein BZA70DRAFT_279091 [Myxozyma melibiosi]|uniref:Tetraspanin Tsp3 n=1 Tax=Myxozyma melibiosi TaxID=54550 RepID=A0ABR1F5J8_9ASCO
MQLTKVAHFHLPLSAFYPVMAMILPTTTLFLLVLPVASKRVFAEQRMIYPATLILLIVLSTLFIALLTPYLTSLSTCVHETAWKALFEAHDPRIEKIETSLKCCGFASLYDRAFPFPSTDDLANACVLKYHYTETCGRQWEHESSVAAEWCVTVFAFVLVGAIACLAHTVLVYKKRALENAASASKTHAPSSSHHPVGVGSYSSFGEFGAGNASASLSEQTGLLEEQTGAGRSKANDPLTN